MKKHILSFCLLLCLLSKSFAASDIFHLTPLRESVLLGGGAALSGTALVLDKIVKVNDDEFDGDLKAKSSIPVFDQIFMAPYSKGLDLTCDVARIAMLAAPVALFGFTTQKEEWLALGFMYSESLLWTYGVTELLKLAVNRARPYMYYDNPPSDDLKNGDWQNSFPSGHTSICFATAAFSSYVFSQYYPEGAKKWVVTGVSFGLAATVGALRMAGGCHYFTDIFTGALIGTVAGFLIPWYHTIVPVNKKVGDAQITATPAGFSITLKK